MDTSWWPALAAVVLLALVAALVDGWGRAPGPGSRRARPSRRPDDRSGGLGGFGRPDRSHRSDGSERSDRSKRSDRCERSAVARPRPAEIWWASVPCETGPGAEGPGAQDRPCLVLSVRGRRARVARITGKYRDERVGVIPLPPGSVGDAQGRTSFLETDEIQEVPVRDFRRRVGVVDPVLWDQVRYLAD
ncbi:type II toxin-antitoxin system PemK/MazF family toxin [Streptomyces thermoalcalitolerans]